MRSERNVRPSSARRGHHGRRLRRSWSPAHEGETAGRTGGLRAAMRDMAERVDAGRGTEPLLDTCGTGGDGAGTFNISTVAAFVVAGARRERGQARQPFHFQPVRQRRAAGSAGREDGADGPGLMARSHSRGGHRLSVRAGHSYRDETRAAGAAGVEDADRVQPPGTADESGRRQRAAGGRPQCGRQRR